MKRITPIAAIAAASMLLVGCQVEKELAVKQEPWASPKGDARVDFAAYESKLEFFSSAFERDNRETDKALAKYETIKLEDGNEAANRWFESDENPMNAAEAEVDSLDKEVYLEKINVAKHLGYSEQRLKEMWEWREVDGPLWIANHKSKELDWNEARDKGISMWKIRPFCEKL